MSQGKRWLRDELIIAMNLYCKLPFGKLHRNNKLIIEVANKLGRTLSIVKNPFSLRKRVYLV
jgi:hypothetical protein